MDTCINCSTYNSTGYNLDVRPNGTTLIWADFHQKPKATSFSAKVSADET